MPDRALRAGRWAQDQFASTNGFMPTPSLARLDEELRAMVGEILRVPEAGTTTLTSGGTESNFLAMRSARNRYLERGGAERPRVVIPLSAHPSFDKAAADLCMDLVRVPLDQNHRADPGAIEAALDQRTCLVAASAPCYPFGLVDPIPRIAALATERGIWMHVDACVGGFLLPFFRRLGVEADGFDLTVPGVDSISADLHKFGFCLNGISTFSLADAANLEYQRFELGPGGWAYQRYVRQGFVGTRSGAAVAAAWAILSALGEEGYLDSARRILDGAARLRDGIGAIDGLNADVPHEGGIFVFSTDEDEVDAGALAGVLQERGWPIRATDPPRRLWLILSPLSIDYYDEFVADLEQSVAAVRAGERGTADTALNTYGSG